jgi:hypothetical protein
LSFGSTAGWVDSPGKGKPQPAQTLTFSGLNFAQKKQYFVFLDIFRSPSLLHFGINSCLFLLKQYLLILVKDNSNKSAFKDKELWILARFCPFNV